MKHTTRTLLVLVAALVCDAANLSAQSGASTESAVTASGEAGEAIARSTTGVLRLASGVAAVPLWLGGAGVAISGAASTSTGESLAATGRAAIKGGDHWWDFATDDPAMRPAMNRERAVPPTRNPVVKAKDPSPAEAFHARS
ncbi:MAG TPA: hypothetical protein VGM73_03875 [Candidatus Didemnitutus sp.]|jgi:hypothetical protein